MKGKERKGWFLDILIQIHRDLLNGGSNGKNKRSGNVRGLRQKNQGGSPEADSLQSSGSDRGFVCGKAREAVR